MEKIDITGVPETMIQTLYARAKESKKERHFIYDPQAVEIVERLDYDFEKADRDAPMSTGVIARTMLLDQMAKDFIGRYPGATVINIACGMDTRFYRVDNGKIRWYDLDLSETISVRRRFLAETARVKMLAYSAMDEAWAQEIDMNGDILVIVEGLTMYLAETDVQRILTIIDRNFDTATVYMEIMSPAAVGRVKEKSIEASGAKFTWDAKNGAGLCALAPAFQFVEDRSLVETMREMYPIYRLLGKIAPIRNLSNKIAVIEKRTEGQV